MRPEHSLLLYAPYFDVALLGRSEVETVRTDSEGGYGSSGRVTRIGKGILCGVIGPIDRDDIMCMRRKEEILSTGMPERARVVCELGRFCIGDGGDDVVDYLFLGGGR